MSSDTYDLERRIGELERKIDSNNSNDSDYKMQALERKVDDLENKIQSSSY